MGIPRRKPDARPIPFSRSRSFRCATGVIVLAFTAANADSEPAVQGHGGARSLREPRSAAPAVLRRHAHPHRVLVRRRQHRTRGTRRSTPTAFAKGEELGLQPYDARRQRRRARRNCIRRPLDFAMVSDHAETFGEVRDLPRRGEPGLRLGLLLLLPKRRPARRSTLMALRTIVSKDRFRLLRRRRPTLSRDGRRRSGATSSAAAEEAYDRTSGVLASRASSVTSTRPQVDGGDEPSPQRACSATTRCRATRRAGSTRRRHATSGRRCSGRASTERRAATC